MGSDKGEGYVHMNEFVMGANERNYADRGRGDIDSEVKNGNKGGEWTGY